jgi:hypothetical protein
LTRWFSQKLCLGSVWKTRVATAVARRVPPMKLAGMHVGMYVMELQQVEVIRNAGQVPFTEQPQLKVQVAPTSGGLGGRGRSRGRALGEEHTSCTTVGRGKNVKGSLKLTRPPHYRAASPFPLPEGAPVAKRYHFKCVPPTLRWVLIGTQPVDGDSTRSGGPAIACGTLD